jgi:hypothetical protein
MASYSLSDDSRVLHDEVDAQGRRYLRLEVFSFDDDYCIEEEDREQRAPMWEVELGFPWPDEFELSSLVEAELRRLEEIRTYKGLDIGKHLSRERDQLIFSINSSMDAILDASTRDTDLGLYSDEDSG